MITFQTSYPPIKRGKSAFCTQYGLNACCFGKDVADALKDCLLPDDTCQYFSAVRHRFRHGGVIEIKILPVKEAAL